MSPAITSISEFGFALHGCFRSLTGGARPAIAAAATCYDVRRAYDATAESPEKEKTLTKAFITALLLTGSAERAEAAVLDGIQQLEPDNPSSEMLFLAAVKAALLSGHEIQDQRPEDLEHAESILPFELRRVLRLPPELRNCFVLRVLAGLPEEACARVLCLNLREVQDGAYAAIRALPGL